MDLYPVLDKTFKKIDWHKVLLYGIVIVLVLFLFKECRKPTPKPSVISGKEVRDTIRLIDNERLHLTDSFNNVISKQDRDIIRYKTNYDDLMTDYLNLQNDITNTFTTAVYPDTCKEIVNLLNGQFTKLKTTSAQKDRAAANTINSLTTQNRTKDKFLASKDSSYNKLLKIADTCSKALSEMEKYAKKIKPKREVSIGLSAIGNYSGNLNPAAGLTIGYRNKKGFDISVSAYTNKVATLTVKKTLFKF